MGIPINGGNARQYWNCSISIFAIPPNMPRGGLHRQPNSTERSKPNGRSCCAYMISMLCIMELHEIAMLELGPTIFIGGLL